MAIQVVKPKHEEMMRCIARFDDIKGISSGIPDMQVEEYNRTFYSVIGFEQPKGNEQYSPFGDAVRPVIGHMAPGFGVAFVKATPGHGAPMHTHDTHETFMVVEGNGAWNGKAIAATSMRYRAEGFHLLSHRRTAAFHLRRACSGQNRRRPSRNNHRGRAGRRICAAGEGSAGQGRNPAGSICLIQSADEDRCNAGLRMRMLSLGRDGILLVTIKWK